MAYITYSCRTGTGLDDLQDSPCVLTGRAREVEHKYGVPTQDAVSNRQRLFRDRQRGTLHGPNGLQVIDSTNICCC